MRLIRMLLGEAMHRATKQRTGHMCVGLFGKTGRAVGDGGTKGVGTSPESMFDSDCDCLAGAMGVT